MPEGDTIHKIARAIAPRLEGRTLASFRMSGDPTLDLRGRRVDLVEARGKHLLVAIEGDLLVRTHLGMHGSWHRYSTGERWKRPERQASVVLATENDVFVCFNAKESECVRVRGARANAALERLGPDLVAEEDPDFDDIVARAEHMLEAEAPVVDALLHQGIACGIGNVYKAEVLFLHRLHPLRRLETLEEGQLEELYRTARRLLRENLHGGARATRTARDGAGELWVYGRGGRECFECGERIASEVLGRGRRITYWCPACQR